MRYIKPYQISCQGDDNLVVIYTVLYIFFGIVGIG